MELVRSFGYLSRKNDSEFVWVRDRDGDGLESVNSKESTSYRRSTRREGFLTRVG